MEGPLPSLNVSSGVSNGPQEPQPDGRQQARKSTVPRGVRFNAWGVRAFGLRVVC